MIKDDFFKLAIVHSQFNDDEAINKNYFILKIKRNILLFCGAPW